jgi:NTE family protein
VLVLGGGGVLGEAWMSSLLAGLADATGFDATGCEGFVGTSAGSIVAAALAAGVAPGKRLGDLPEQPPAPDAAAAAGAGLPARALDAGLAIARLAAAPFAALGLRATETGGALLRRAALAQVPHGQRSLGRLGEEIARMGPRWDGRLTIAAVELASGRRVMFGSPGAPAASVAQAVEASCAIPGVFRPIAVNGRSYVDGGAWSPTNMDVATVNPGARVLCLNPTAALWPSRDALFGAIGPVSRVVALLEALALERRGAKVRTVAPDEASTAALGANFMDPRRRAQVIEAGVAQGRALELQPRGE